MGTIFVRDDAGRHVPIELVEPVAQTTSNSYAAITGGNVNTRPWRSLALTLKNTGVANDLDWTLYGANVSDFSDEVVIQAEATVGEGTVGSYSTTQAVFSYYRAKVKSTIADGAHTTTALLRAVMKE